MANEAVIIELLGNKGDPIQYNVADAAALAKGELLKLADNRTVVTSAAGICAGICAMEKVALDGSTTVSAYTNGIFDLLEGAAAGIGIGVPVILQGANAITVSAGGDAELGKLFGIALAVFAGSDTQSVKVLI